MPSQRSDFDVSEDPAHPVQTAIRNAARQRLSEAMDLILEAGMMFQRLPETSRNNAEALAEVKDLMESAIRLGGVLWI